MSDALTWSTTAASSRGAESHSREPTPEDDGQDHDALRPGTRIDEFEIVRVLGAGGFGIVYLALDQVLMRHVAIKEYMPTSLAGRGKGSMVSVRSAALVETFATGLESFFNEARMLASFDHPSLVKVHRFWKANGTAYMVMQYYPGQTLKEARTAMTAAPDEAWLRSLAEPLLGALETLHAQGVYHRDIAPDNILLLPDGRPVLLDFGSARRVIGDRTQTLTAILKPNFAPVEQYADDAAMRQGPWTDLYALGATLHFVLTGNAPTPAVLRAVRDSLPPLANREAAAFPGVGDEFLAVIDWSLALAPEARPQTAGEMRRALCGEFAVPPLAARFAAPPALIEGERASLKTVPVVRRGMVPAAPSNEVEAAAAVAGKPRRSVLVGGLGVAVMLVAAIIWVAQPRAPSAARESTSAAAALSAIPLAAADAASQSNTHPSNDVPIASTAAIAPTPAAAVRKASSSAPGLASTVAVASAGTAASAAATARRQRSSEAPPALVMQREPELCGGMNFFSRTVCLARECRSPQHANQPACVDIRRTEEDRQQSMERR
jgi:serine/threonine protein kinase